MGVDIPIWSCSLFRCHRQLSWVFDDPNSCNTVSETKNYFADIYFRMHSLKRFAISDSISIKCLPPICFMNLSLVSGNKFSPIWYGFSMLVMKGECSYWMDGKFSEIDKIISCIDLYLVIVWFLPLAAQLFASSVVMSQQWRNWLLETSKIYSRFVQINSHFPQRFSWQA